MRTISRVYVIGEILMKDAEIKERWEHYLKWIMNDENTDIETKEGVTNKGITNTTGEQGEALGGMTCGGEIVMNKRLREA